MLLCLQSSSRSAFVPKFGAWDERDPKSGEGFTIIFDKIKKEKRVAAAKFPLVHQPQTRNNQETTRNHETRRSKVKILPLF